MRVSSQMVNVPPSSSQPSRAALEKAQRAYTRPAERPAANGAQPKVDLRQGLTREYLQEALTTRVGKAVQDTLAAHGMDINAAVGVDVSPEATSDRIVAGTTSLLGVFARQNPKLSKAELIDKFEATIRPAIKKGYREALDILSGFEEFDSGMRAMTDKTQALVDQKLDSYFADLRKSLDEQAA